MSTPTGYMAALQSLNPFTAASKDSQAYRTALHKLYPVLSVLEPRAETVVEAAEAVLEASRAIVAASKTVVAAAQIVVAASKTAVAEAQPIAAAEAEATSKLKIVIPQEEEEMKGFLAHKWGTLPYINDEDLTAFLEGKLPTHATQSAFGDMDFVIRRSGLATYLAVRKTCAAKGYYTEELYGDGHAGIPRAIPIDLHSEEGLAAFAAGKPLPNPIYLRRKKEEEEAAAVAAVAAVAVSRRVPRIYYPSLDEFWPAIRARNFTKMLGGTHRGYVKNKEFLAARIGITVAELNRLNPLLFAKRTGMNVRSLMDRSTYFTMECRMNSVYCGARV